jgi:hypothetical protein
VINDNRYRINYTRTKYTEYDFAFCTMHFLKVTEKPTNALIIQFIGTQYPPTCFRTLKCHHQGVKHDPAEIRAQCCVKQRRMGAVYCNRRRDGWDIEYQYIE